MRFTSNGPIVPNNLLNARDDGCVVFICGAGVSLHKANLPNFLHLTIKVIEDLGLEKDNAIYKLLTADKEIQKRTDHSLLSLDRIFGLLERDFSIHDIEHYVAKALKPVSDVDLSAHRTLLKLSKTPDGNTQLVTTNFDNLFEKSDLSLPSYSPSTLPHFSKNGKLNGITHLHGIVNNEYTKSDGNGFVLSSSEFGNAYLVEAWATKFIQSILKDYSVVFVGYSADDPPVRYLLEALKKQSHLLQNMYAFHYSGDGNAQSAWESKGVEPIVYAEHHHLWETLSLWANRAEDPKAWMLNTLTQLNTKPSEIEAYQRGQVAHIISRNEGMHIMSNMPEPLSAEWLCVFDVSLRYSKPIKPNFWDDESVEINPFERYHLDDDIAIQTEEDNLHTKQDIPNSSWNCLSLTELDKTSLKDKNHISIFHTDHFYIHTLANRLIGFSEWLIKVADDPIVLWWAIKNGGLNLSIVEKFLHRFEREENLELFETWNDLLNVWKSESSEQKYKLYHVEEYYEKQQWSEKLLNEIIDRYYQPILQINSDMGYVSFPPVDQDTKTSYSFIRYETKYKDILELNIKDEWLYPFVKKFRNIIEKAVETEKHYSAYSDTIDPFHRLPEKDEGVHFAEGLSEYVHYFKTLLEQLSQYDINLVRKEFFAWDLSDEVVFAHLSLWVSSQSDILSGEEAGNTILSLPDGVIWASHTQRDILMSLSNRWNEYPLPIRKSIEKRLLNGRERYDYEDEPTYLDHNAFHILNRIQYLHENGCTFSFDFENKKAKLKQYVTDWQEDYAQSADKSSQGRGGTVHQSSEYTDLLSIPLDAILQKSLEIMKDRTKFLHENRPFSGLAEAKPVRALSVLTHTAKNGEYPKWAWQAFFYEQQDTNIRFNTLIGYRVLRIPLKNLKDILDPLLSWYKKIANSLKENSPELFEAIWNRIILYVKTYPEIGNSSMTTNSKHYPWLEHAGRTPQGELAKLWITMLPDKSKEAKRLTKKDLLLATELLSLPSPINRFSLVVFSQHISWFYSRNKTWTNKHMLVFLKQSDEDVEAFFSGSLKRAIPSISLLTLLKKDLIHFATANKKDVNFTRKLANAILLLWANVDKKTNIRIITDADMREVLLKSTEKFRLETLWNLFSLVQQKADTWDDNTINFIKNVWPRQISIKNHDVFFRLNNLLFLNTKIFLGISNDVIRLTKGYSKKDFNFQRINIEDNEIIEKHPEDVLNFLDEVLTEDIFRLPYGLDDILSKIVSANPTLKEDSRLSALQRRCNAL